jgi:hypothetical protein
MPPLPAVRAPIGSAVASECSTVPAGQGNAVAPAPQRKTASCFPLPVQEPYCAIGAGRDFALGALHAGSDATGAALAAVRHSSLVKGPVRVYRLKAKPC